MSQYDKVMREVLEQGTHGIQADAEHGWGRFARSLVAGPAVGQGRRPWYVGVAVAAVLTLALGILTPGGRAAADALVTELLRLVSGSVTYQAVAEPDASQT